MLKTVPTRSPFLAAKAPQTAPAAGRIRELLLGQGIGIITSHDHREVFFHKTAAGGRFFELHVGDSVRFDLLNDTISGPRAERVRVEPPRRTR